jgi:ABC-type branched-subunit amino acid transport system substrate-binding protein
MSILHIFGPSRLRTSFSLRMLLTLLACLVAAPLSGQERSSTSYEAEVLFLDGVGLYDSLHFKEARTAFDLVLNLFPGSHRTTAASIMKAKALFQMGENVESVKSLQKFLVEFDSSAYCADAHLTLGLVYRRLGRPGDALQELMQARQRVPPSRPVRLVQAVTNALDSLTLFELSSQDIQAFLVHALPPDGAVYLRTKLVERAWREGDLKAARMALDTLVAATPSRDTSGVVAGWRARLSQPRALRLAAVLALLSKEGESQRREIGNDVYRGISYAMDEFARDSSSSLRVSLVTRDTERDTIEVYRAVRELAADSSIVGFIGPLYSTTSFAAARASSDVGLPMVTPTATANGIAATGRYVFQANPDYDMRGRAMAKHAVNKLGFQQLAVLAPSNSHGRYLAEGFINEAVRLGAHIVATQWYESGTSDLTSQLMAIRRAVSVGKLEPYLSFAVKRKRAELQKLVALGIPMERMDSLMQRGAVVRVTTLLGPRAKARLDSAGIAMVFHESVSDVIDTPTEGIQAIYLPITSPQEIGVVSSQLAYFNIAAQLLGSGDWNSLTDLDANKRYCSGMLFESDSYVDTASLSYKRILEGFTARFKEAPSQYALYGFDAAAMCLSVVHEGGINRQAFGAGVAKVRAYQGVHAKLGFSSARVNSWIGIMRFDGTGIQCVDEIQVE